MYRFLGRSCRWSTGGTGGSSHRCGVAPDGARAYVSDIANGEVAVYDLIGRAEVAAIPVPAFDLALSADGTKLFVGGPGTVSVVDTRTNTVAAAVSIGDENTTTIGIALSPNGRHLGVVTTDGGTAPSYLLFDVASDLTLAATIPIAGDVAGCDAFPNDTVFASDQLALVWDSNCDSIYEVDVGAGAQIASSTMDLGRDSGSLLNSNNAIVFLPSTGLAVVVKESNELVAIDPAARTFTTAASFADPPFTLAATTNGRAVLTSVVHAFVDAGGDTLSRVNFGAPSPSGAVYRFADSGKIVRDLHVVAP